MRRGFLAAIAGTVLFTGPARAACQIETVEIPVYMAGTQPRVTIGINATESAFVLDTGAMFSMISTAAAEQLQLPRVRGPELRMYGIGGRADVHVARVERLTIKNSVFSNVHFMVGGALLGPNVVGLLGQNFLGTADTEYDLANGVMRLHSPNADCKNVRLAYWAKNQPVSEVELEFGRGPYLQHLVADAFVNGVKVQVLFDTGASLSILSMQAARRVGLTPETPGVVKGRMSGGVGSREVQTWLAPVKSFALGDEKTLDTRIRFGDFELTSADMLLGADFFLAHRIYFSKGQSKAYFTYNGGPVFNLAGAPPARDEKRNDSEGAAAPDDQSAPTTADGYARRAAAFAARGNFQRALADYNRACEMEPSIGKFFAQRGRVQLALRQPSAAMADFTEAIRLDPGDADARLARARLRMNNRDVAGARDDLAAIDASAPPQSAIRLDVARLYLLMHEPAAALPQLNQWIATHDTEVTLHEALSDRCWARATLGTELDKALSDCDAALKARPTAARYDRRGLVHLRMGNPDKAIDDYNEALRLEPKSPWALFGRGIARIAKGDEQGGRADIAAATAINAAVEKDAARYGLRP